MVENIKVYKAQNVDVEEILSLYEIVSISRRGTLSPSVDNLVKSFGTEGGIFSVPRNQLLDMVTGNEYIVLIAKVEESEVAVGYYAVKKNISKETFIQLQLNSSEEKWIKSFSDAFYKQAVAFSIDTIIHPAYRKLGIATQLKQIMIEHLRYLNCVYLIIEIYEIEKFYLVDSDGIPQKVHEINTKNYPSVKLHRKLNAHRIGQIQRPVQRIGKMRFYVKSNVYSIDL